MEVFFVLKKCLFWRRDYKEMYFKVIQSHPCYFFIALIPISMILTKVRIRYQLRKYGLVENHLIMKDLKLFSKSEIQIDSLLKTRI